MIRYFERGLEIICGFILAFAASVPLHETGHLLMARAFGVPGYIEMDWSSLGGVFQQTADFTSNAQVVVVGLAGGLFVAALYGLLLLALVKTRAFQFITPALILVGLVQLGYGIGEGIGYETSVAPLFCGMALGLLLAALRLKVVAEAYAI